jgi:hypothetical protein
MRKPPQAQDKQKIDNLIDTQRSLLFAGLKIH